MIHRKDALNMTAAANLETQQSKLVQNLPLFVTVICALQPLMDVLSFWQAELGMGNTLTLALRFGVLAVVAMMGFFLSRQKKVYIISGIVCAALWAAHCMVCMQKGYLDPLSDVINYVRVIQMPLFAVCFITFMKRNPRSFEGIKRGFAVNFIIITAVLVLSLLTGTCRPTYDVSSLGLMGWFSTSNAQSAILSMLTPVVVWMAYESKRYWLLWVTVAAAYIQLFYIGTRLAFAAMVATTIGLTFTFMVTRHVDWKRIAALFVCLIIVVGCTKYGPMYKNRNYYSDYTATQQGYAAQEMEESMNSLMGDDPNEEINFEDLTDAEKRRVLAPIYTFYSNDLCRRFTVNTVIEAYNYTYTVSDLTNARVHKITYCELLQQEHPAASKLFGMELERMVWQDENYDVENDFHGVYFLFGAVGLGLMLAFLGYFVYLILWALKKDARKYFTTAAGAFGISFCIAIVNAYFTAGVLRRPNSSFYLSVLLAVIFYLVCIKKYDGEDTLASKMIKRAKRGKREEPAQ